MKPDNIVFSIFPLIVVFIVIWLILRDKKRVFDFFLSIGAKNIKTITYPYIKAELIYEDTILRLWTSGLKGNFKLNIGIPVYTSGYLNFRKYDFFDRLFFQKRINNLAVIYEDQRWAERLINRFDFINSIQDLFDTTNIHSFSIKNREIVISWLMMNVSHLHKIDKEKIFLAIKKLKDIRDALNDYSSTTLKIGLRNFLVFGLPISITAFLIIAGIVGKFYVYKPVCRIDLILVGYKIFIPIFLAYIIFALFLLCKNRTLIQNLLGSLLYVGSVCSIFIILFFFPFLNGYFDYSQSLIKKDYIENKYIGYSRWNSGPIIVLSDFYREKPWWCDNSFKVSREFYDSVEIGDEIEYSVKQGFLGIEWFYSDLRIKK